MACLIAAPCSGSGKTLLTLALTALLRQRGRSVQTFKVGPDYLDPQLLSRVSGRPCRNLDRLLCGSSWVERSFHWWGRQADHCLVEGVMGLFDGRGPGDEGSSAELAAALQLPVVLVVEASRQAGSVAALVNGFRHHRYDLTMAGVVLNGVSTARHQALLSDALAAIGMPVLGLLPRHPGLSLPSRHLGLLPAHELHNLEGTCAEWAALAERHLDLERLLPLLAPPSSSPSGSPASSTGGDPIRWALGLEGEAAAPEPVTLAIAADAAFHFRYPEATELLEAMGVELQPWQPLADAPLPPDCQGGNPAGRVPGAARAGAGCRPAQPGRPAACRGRRPADLRRMRRPAAAGTGAGGSAGRGLPDGRPAAVHGPARSPPAGLPPGHPQPQRAGGTLRRTRLRPRISPLGAAPHAHCTFCASCICCA